MHTLFCIILTFPMRVYLGDIMETVNIGAEIFSEKVENRIHLGRKGISTLMIPETFSKDLERKSKKYGGKPKYFSYLLRRFRPLMRSLLSEPSGLRKIYQEKNQALVKVNFRPSNEDWAELGTFSIAAGRSRCLLFVLLLVFDLAGFGSILKKAGVVMNDPFSPKCEWELIGCFGVDPEASECIRSFTPKRKIFSS